MNELKKSQKIDLVIEEAREHAKKLGSLIIQGDNDFSFVKSEKAKANKLIKAIASTITETRKEALAIVDEEISTYKTAKDEVEKIYKDFFEKVLQEQKARDLQIKENFKTRVQSVISEKALSITFEDVPDVIFTATKSLKTNKRLTDLLLALQAEKDRKESDLKNIKEKAVSLSMSSAKYVAMLEDGMPPTEVFNKIENDAKSLKAEEIELARKKKELEAQELARIEREKEELREQQKQLKQQQDAMKELEKERKETERKELEEKLFENKKLELQGKTKVEMEIVYKKTPENSEALNKLLKQMKEIAEVTLKK